MARIPTLDRFIGMDRLAVWHRRNGQYVVSLLVAHTLLSVWGYALIGHSSLLSEARRVVLDYPDMLMATVALVLLVLVAFSSVQVARKHLRYETWHFIHLYSYLAIALSFSHQLASGDDFVGHPLNRVLWSGLYAMTVGVFLAYRVGLPVRDAVRHRLRIDRIVRETEDVVSVYVTGRRMNELRADAGQFVRWRFLTRTGWWQAHPFSLSQAPNGKWLRMTVKRRGDHTSYVHGLHPGVRVMAEGPYGAFTRHRRVRRKVLLIAGGIGIAPVRALFEALPGRSGDLTLLYRSSGEHEIVFSRELDELAEERDAAVHYILGPRSQQPDPLGRAHLLELVPDLRQHEVFVCGPSGMTLHAVASLEAAGVPRRHIHTEGFAY